MNPQEEEREGVRAAFRRLWKADRAKGAAHGLSHYKNLFPGFWEVVAEEFEALHGAHGPSTAGPPASPARSPQEAPGGNAPAPDSSDLIGPYRILQELGRGGMGVVYEAQDTRLPRRVALKVLPAQFAASKGLQMRFRREAALASKLDHPNICTVFEAGESDGTSFMAMRLLEGRTLAEWIRLGREANPASGVVELPPSAKGESGKQGAPGGTKVDIDRVLLLLEKAARALHVAHEKGLIHRDIKPHNIMVTAEGEPVLLDFGLAREEAGEGHQLTQTGSLMGTPAYMSPEQLMAQRIPLDRRTDIYSLGVTLYECLTLRLPFEAPTLDGLYQKILATEPEDPRRINRALSLDIRAILQTALDKDRNRRYASAEDFAEDLRRTRENIPVRARSPGRLLTVTRWVQRNPALASLFLALAAGLGTSVYLLGEAVREKDERERLLERMRDAAGLKEKVIRQALLESSKTGVGAVLRTVIRDPRRELTYKGGIIAPTGDLVAFIHQPYGTRVVLPGIYTNWFYGNGAVMKASDVSGDEVASVPISLGHYTGQFSGIPYPPTIEFSGDGKYLVAGSQCPGGNSSSAGDTTSVITDAGGREVARTEKGSSPRCMPHGQRMVTHDLEHAYLWDMGGHPLATLDHAGCLDARFSLDGSRVLTIGGGTTRVWSPEGRLEGTVPLKSGNGDIIEVLPGEGGVLHVAVGDPSRSSRILAMDGSVRRDLGPDVDPGYRWSPRRGMTESEFMDPSVPAGAFLLMHRGGTARLWAFDGTLKAQFTGPEAAAHGFGSSLDGVALDPAGKHVLTIRSGLVVLWSSTGTLLASLPFEEKARYARFFPSGDRILVETASGSMCIWDIYWGGR